MKPRKGDMRLDVWFFSPEEAIKPPKDGTYLIGRTVQWVIGARYAVWKFRWNGVMWVRVRRESGPLCKHDAEARLNELQARRVATMEPA